ncbi:Na+/H+ antiporter subunit G [Marivibrio halodurans]|uniref:Na+/H+ antiporter subunit G n=1 Tax=Marivibrio halodurans TaxID=2039722 RepID=A0A8J7V137_9PROT|nr:Na+/H+ antiporter subunit G [Marivibrio halodurans]MBP5855432.1 Na+/H+ antiporter subunit G [Marivibrio halodurans]
MTLLAEILVSVLIVAAGFFGLVGSYGLAKLPDLMTRLHAPTKASTLGIGGILIASMIWALMSGHGFSSHELLITLFIFLTAPITANFLAKSHLHRRIERRESLPAPEDGASWATFEAPEATHRDEPSSIAAARLRGEQE